MSPLRRNMSNILKCLNKKFQLALYKHTEKLIARAYVRQCERLADGDEMKLKDYMMPPTHPICLFASIEKETENGDVELGEFISIRNEFNEEWVLTFDDYGHANEMAEQILQITGNKAEARRTSSMTIYTHEAPIMGASCCKTDGTVIETPSSVYKAIIHAMIVKQRLKQARINELAKRSE